MNKHQFLLFKVYNLSHRYIEIVEKQFIEIRLQKIQTIQGVCKHEK